MFRLSPTQVILYERMKGIYYMNEAKKQEEKNIQSKKMNKSQYTKRRMGDVNRVGFC